MKPIERDELLIRLDEKCESIMRELVSLNEHQVEQNGHITDTIEKTAKNTTWVIAFRWILGTGATILSIVLTRLYGLW